MHDTVPTGHVCVCVHAHADLEIHYEIHSRIHVHVHVLAHPSTLSYDAKVRSLVPRPIHSITTLHTQSLFFEPLSIIVYKCG